MGEQDPTEMPPHYTEYDVNADLSDVDYSDVKIEKVLIDTDKFPAELERVGARKFARALIQAAAVATTWSDDNGDGNGPEWTRGSEPAERPAD